MRDWVNKCLVYQPIATVSYPAMVHRTVLPGIGPSYFPHFRTMTMILVTSDWLSICETSQTLYEIRSLLLVDHFQKNALNLGSPSEEPCTQRV